MTENLTMSSCIARCACGQVELEAIGRPITSVECYCEDCRTAARQIEALPNAAPVREPDDGVAYVAFRKDRVRIVQGGERLRGLKLREDSATRRMIATCCNTAVVLEFDDAKHWVDVYRRRLIGVPPPIEMRICTKYRPGLVADPAIPAYPGYPLPFMLKLIGAKFGMLFRR